jgi:hypothetical protein
MVSRSTWLVVVVCLAGGAARADRVDRTRDEALLDALALGLPPAEARAALDAAAAIPGAEAVLAGYTRARDPSLRAHAVAALGAGPRVLAALGDPDADVRAAAGTALAARRDGRAVAPLLALLARGDPVAAAPLAALANAGVARAVAELVGRAPDALLARTVGLMLLRRDLGPDTVYLALVRALGGLPGADAVAALRAYVAAAAPGRPSRREAETLAEARGPSR